MNWVIGDVHGMYDPLRRLLDRVAAADAAAVLTFAGDYVNRGPDAKGVIDLLLTLGPEVRFCRGNHDDVFDLVLHGTCVAPRAAGNTPAEAYAWFSGYGLDHTFHSYGNPTAALRAAAEEATPERLARLVASVPEAHRRFIRGLPLVAERGTFFVSHGYWPPDRKCFPPDVSADLAADAELRQLVLWGRFSREQIAAEKPAWGKPGVFGHTPIHTYYPAPAEAPMVPIAGPKLTLIDTACALTPRGRLTAFCVEEQRGLQVTRTGEDVGENDE